MVAAAPAPEPHWVAQPGMQSLLTTWAEPIAQAGCLHTDTQAVRLERDRLHPQGWQLACEASDGSTAVYAGFDTVLLALPAPKAHALLQSLGQADVLLIAGEASSHCVRSTTEHIVQHLPRLVPGWQASRIVLLTDGMSPVAGFEAQHQAFLDGMRTAGAQLASMSEISL